MLIDGGGCEALVGHELVDRDDLSDIEPGAPAGCALVEHHAVSLEALHRLAAVRAIERREGLAARAAGVVGLKAAVAGPAAARGHRLLERGVSGAEVCDATSEGIADRPESVAAGTEAERVDRLEFEAAKDRHLRVVRAVGTGGLGIEPGLLRGVTPKVGEDRFRVALPGA